MIIYFWYWCINILSFAKLFMNNGKSFNHRIYIVTMILLYHKKSLKWWQIINCDWGYRHESGNWSPVVQSDTINEVSPASYETNFDLSVARTFFMSEEALIQSVLLYQLSDISSKVAHGYILCKYTILSDNANIHILLYYFTLGSC